MTAQCILGLVRLSNRERLLCEAHGGGKCFCFRKCDTSAKPNLEIVAGINETIYNMDELDVEKEELLASIRLQEKALSVSVTDTCDIITCDSDSDDGKESNTENDIPVIKLAGDNSDSNEGTVEEKRQVTFTDALSANMEYDEALAKVEQDIRQNLEKIDKDLTAIRNRLSRLGGEVTATSTRSHWTYIFGMPYFKDSNLYPCPPNEDYHTKKKNHEICWSELPQFHQWVPKLKKNLVGAIRKLSLQKCETKAKVNLAALRKDLEAAKETQDSERVAVLEAQVANFSLEDEAKSLLQDTIENDEHDWMQISAKYLNGRQSPEGCRSFWLMYLHPKINKGPWTSDEETALKKIAKKHYLEDWDQIAEELGTKRSGYQCFIVYQTKLSDSLKRNIWTVEEDQRLAAVIEQCRIGDYVPWGKVAFNMDGRTKAQVFNRWTYSINPSIKKGRFTTAEDIMILVGVNMWGEDFQRIANFMKERTTCQVRDRYKNYLGRGDLNIPWESQDDERLMVLVSTYGRNWAKISEHFPTKDRTQVRHRYGTIEKWRQTHPDEPIEGAPMRRCCPRSRADFSVQWERAKAILSCETIDEMVEAKEKLVSSLRGNKKIIKPKKKKTSLVEADMINYFRCCHDVPGGRRRYQLRPGESDKYAEEIMKLIRLFDVKLNLPSIEEIQADRTLTFADKDILVAVITKTTAANIKQSPPGSPTSMLERATRLYTDTFLNTGCNSVSAKSTTSNIDYVHTHSASSTYIDLPLLNFHNDEVVVATKNIIDADTVCERTEDFVFVNADTPEVENIMKKKKKPEELYICPPNFTNLVGLRTFLLNRRTLVEWSNRDRCVSKFSDVANQNKKVARAVELFNRRMLSLFLWPALMSRTGPTANRIFFEPGENPPKANYAFCRPVKRKAPVDNKKPKSSENCSKLDQSVSSPNHSRISKKRRLLCPTSGKIVCVSEESSVSDSEKGNKSDESEESNDDSDTNEEEKLPAVEVVDIADDNSIGALSTNNAAHSSDKILSRGTFEDNSAGVSFSNSSQNLQLFKASEDSEQFFVANYNDSTGVNLGVVSRNICMDFDGPFISEHGKFISGPDISLASLQGVLVEDGDDTLPNFQVVEVLEDQSLGFSAENSTETSTTGNFVCVGSLCPYTGRLVSNANVPIPMNVEEDSDEDPDGVPSIDLC